MLFRSGSVGADLPLRLLQRLLTLVTAFTVVGAMTAVGVVLVIGLLGLSGRCEASAGKLSYHVNHEHC